MGGKTDKLKAEVEELAADCGGLMEFIETTVPKMTALRRTIRDNIKIMDDVNEKYMPHGTKQTADAEKLVEADPANKKAVAALDAAQKTLQRHLDQMTDAKTRLRKANLALHGKVVDLEHLINGKIKASGKKDANKYDATLAFIIGTEEFVKMCAKVVSGAK